MPTLARAEKLRIGKDCMELGVEEHQAEIMLYCSVDTAHQLAYVLRVPCLPCRSSTVLRGPIGMLAGCRMTKLECVSATREERHTFLRVDLERSLCPVLAG